MTNYRIFRQRSHLAVATLTFVLGCFGDAFAQPTCAPLTSGSVSWWRAENSSLDQIGGNNGTNVGAVSFVAGETGQAFVFGGSGAAVKLGNPANLRLQNFTIEGWIARSDASV